MVHVSSLVELVVTVSKFSLNTGFGVTVKYLDWTAVETVMNLNLNGKKRTFTFINLLHVPDSCRICFQMVSLVVYNFVCFMTILVLGYMLTLVMLNKLRCSQPLWLSWMRRPTGD